MSLILEALRKLDREKQAPDRGLLVTGATTWARPERHRGARLAWLLLAGAALALGAWLLRSRTAHAPAETTAAGTGASRAVVPPTGEGRAAAGADTPGAATPAPGAAAALVPVGAASPPAPPSRGVEPAPAHSHGLDTAAAPPAGAPSEPPPPAPAALAAHETEPPSAAGESPPAQAPPAAAPATGDDRVVLQAVSERDGRPVAIVNGRLVREGDSFDGITIVRIRPTEIEVEVDGRHRVVSF